MKSIWQKQQWFKKTFLNLYSEKYLKIKKHIENMWYLLLTLIIITSIGRCLIIKNKINFDQEENGNTEILLTEYTDI